MSLLVLLASLAAAQTHQGALWLGVEGELAVSRKVELSLSEEFRQGVLQKGNTELLTEVTARVDLAKWAALQGGYRLGADVTTPKVEHRLTTDLRLGHRVGLVRLKLRQRYQVDFVPRASHTLRTRLAAEARFDTAHPFLWVEPFFPLSGGARLHKIRFTAGVKVPTKGPTLRVFSHFEPQLDGDWLLVGGLGGTFEARTYKKKKDKG